MEQLRGQRCGQAVHVESPAGVPLLDVGLECQSDVLYLRIAYLKPAPNLDAVRVAARRLGNPVDEGWCESEHQGRVRLVHLPARGHTRRDDINVTVDRHAGVSFGSMSAFKAYWAPQVNGNDWSP